MSAVRLDRPWLEFDLGDEMQVLSWAVHRPGLVRARRILWREVRNADLPRDLDVERWLADALAERGASDAVTMMTSRNLNSFTEAAARVGDTEAHAVTTVGFANAERVGQRIDRSGKDWGTINIALRLSAGLTEPALVEAMSIAVQARTAAVKDAHLKLPSGFATGTGTDCVAVASPAGAVRYAGLHTDLGEAIGQATYGAVTEAAQAWIAEHAVLDETGHWGVA